MEYCSHLWAGSTASHLAQLDAVEARTFRIVEISHNEAVYMGPSLFHRRQLGDLSVFDCLLSDLAPSAFSVLWLSPGFCRGHMVHHQPPLGETT